MYNINHNTSVKKKENNISIDLLTEIKRKSQSEPTWLKEISDNLIKENNLAKQSGIREKINESKKRLESFNVDLDGFNEMPLQRKSQKHIIDFTKERYKPLESNWDNDRDLYKRPISENKRNVYEGNSYGGINNGAFYINSDNKKTGVSSKEQPLTETFAEKLKGLGLAMDKYGHIRELSKVPENLIYRPGRDNVSAEDAVFRFDQDDKPEIVKYSLTSKVKDIVKEIKKDADVVEKKRDNELVIKNDPGYVTSKPTKDDDHSKTYGVTILRDVEDSLGTDTVVSRIKSTAILSKYADDINRISAEYDVKPAVVGGCIFTEQACNVIPLEAVVDKAVHLIGKDASFGIGQVKVSTAKEIENSGIIKETIKFVRIDKAGQVWWDVPGVGVMNGTYEDAIKARLENPVQNIEYVASYLKLLQNNWMENARVDLTEKIDVWMTLYNIGINKEKGYNNNPQSNDFGKYGGANYYYITYILNQ